MSQTLTIIDRTPAGQTIGELTLDGLTDTITVQALIRCRVYQEVKDYNMRRPSISENLVRPADAEQLLNGRRPTTAPEIDWESQLRTAVTAFKKKHFVILVNDRQMASLDDDITLEAGTRVTFLRLVPLVGG